MNEKLSVNAIQNGTVIDHITAGQALPIVHLLSLEQSHYQITLGMHLASKRLGTKDLLKIEDKILSEPEANKIVVFAPDATINIVQEFKVIKKIKTHFPPTMKSVFVCPNQTCITQTEPLDSYFYIQQHHKQIKLTCHYCNKIFDRDKVKVKIKRDTE